ncbi:unnamed protein product, partial [Porites lobata]
NNNNNKSASEKAKALKHVFKSKMKSMKEEKWKNKALHGQGTTCSSSRPGNKHQKLPENHDIEITDKWYEHEPETVIHNKDSNITIMWDMPVNTDRTVTANRPDIIVKDSVNSTCKLIDMTVPSDRNIALKETEQK